LPKGYKYKKEVHGMSKKCEICGKGQVSGNNVSHSMRHTRRKWNANIQKVRVVDENGTVRRANVCTRCMRSGLVNRAL
jgi:large subunit ribosomal protein L28